MNYPFYEPVTISIPEQDLRNILDCLESGLESSQELLIQHDVNFGRTTKKIKCSPTFWNQKLSVQNHQSHY
jgi:hypothetical protein